MQVVIAALAVLQPVAQLTQSRSRISPQDAIGLAVPRAETQHLQQSQPAVLADATSSRAALC